MAIVGKPSAEEFARLAVDFELIDMRSMNAVWADLGTHNVSSVRREVQFPVLLAYTNRLHQMHTG